MPIFKGTWKAKVDQDFEIEAESELDARCLLDEEMSPHNVVELHDFEFTIEEVSDDEG